MRKISILVLVVAFVVSGATKYYWEAGAKGTRAGSGTEYIFEAGSYTIEAAEGCAALRLDSVTNTLGIKIDTAYYNDTIVYHGEKTCYSVDSVVINDTLVAIIDTTDSTISVIVNSNVDTGWFTPIWVAGAESDSCDSVYVAGARPSPPTTTAYGRNRWQSWKAIWRRFFW